MTLGVASTASASAFGPDAEHFDQVEALADRARALTTPAATVLVKGSRSMRMERIVQALAGVGQTTGGHH
jgi:UDP-N-acetylmuramoyl-tripeptide--D-alanyl-D-alanine ligase